MIRIRFLLLGSLCFLLGSVGLQAQQFTVTNQQLVSSVRVSLYLYDYTYSVAVTNNGPDALSVGCTVTSSVPQTIVRSGNLSFGAVSQGQTVTSTNTLVIRQDRRYPFSWSNLQWQWSSTATAGWAPTTVATTLFPVTMQLVSLTLTSTESLTNVSLLVSGSGASFASVAPATIALQANQPANVSVTVEIPSGTTLTTVQLTVSAFFGSQKIAPDANVVLNVVNPSGIPGSPATPSVDRIVQAPSGRWVVQDQLLVMLNLDTPDPAATITAIASQTGGIIVGSIPDLLYYQLQYPGMADQLQSIAAQIGSLPNVSGAIQEYMVAPAQTPITVPQTRPNDQYFDLQWGLLVINAPQAWSVLQQLLPVSPGFRAVPLAIVDGDLDPSNPDLAPNLNASLPRFVNQSGQAVDGHGTAVAGIACAKGNNWIGITGTTWTCDLRLYQAPQQCVAADDCEFDVADLVNNMDMAVEGGARIVNGSFGVSDAECGKALDMQAALADITNAESAFAGVIQKAGKNVLWVFAAGNECSDAIYETPANLSLTFPDNVITVGAVDQYGSAPNWSNYGPAVTVAAPGVGIFSTLPVNEYYVNEYYHPYGKVDGTGDGTSFAAPFVSGVAALVWSMHPDYTAKKVRDCIVASAAEKVPGATLSVQSTHSKPRSAEGSLTTTTPGSSIQRPYPYH